MYSEEDISAEDIDVEDLLLIEECMPITVSITTEWLTTIRENIV